MVIKVSMSIKDKRIYFGRKLIRICLVILFRQKKKIELILVNIKYVYVNNAIAFFQTL